MKGLPAELIYILVFGAILLFNFVMQRAARRKQAEAASQEPPPQEIPEAMQEIPEAVWGRARPTPAALPEPEAGVPPARYVVAPSASPAAPGRRFVRRSLLGTRRAAQDAFVVAAILGRCRADEPHDVR